MSGFVSETMRYVQFYNINSEIKKKNQNGALVKSLFGKEDLKNG